MGSKIKVMFYIHFPLATVWRALVGRQPSYIWGPRWRTKALSEYPPHIPPASIYSSRVKYIRMEECDRTSTCQYFVGRKYPYSGQLTIFWFFGETRRSFVFDAPWHIRFNFCCRRNTKDHHIFMTSWKLDYFQQNNSPEHGIKIFSRFQSQKWKRNNRKTRDSRKTRNSRKTRDSRSIMDN